MGELSNTILGEPENADENPNAAPPSLNDIDTQPSKSSVPLSQLILSGGQDTTNQDAANLQISNHLATDTTPDTAARVLKLQAKTGLPEDLIERNLDSVESEANQANFDPQKFQQSSPIVAKWLSESPNHFAVAKTDLSHLNYLERQIGYISSQFHEGMQSNELADIGESAFMGTVTPEQRQRQAEIEADQAKQSDYGINGFWASAIGKTANALPFLGKTFLGKAEAAGIAGAGGAGLGAAVGFLAGGEGPQGVVTIPAAAATFGTEGALAGWKYGGAVQMARMITGQTYLDFEKLKDDDGNPINPTVARGAAGIVGVASGLMDFVAFQKIFEKVPGIGNFTATGVKSLLSNPTTRATFSAYAKNVGEAMATNGLMMFSQQYLKDATTEVLKMGADTQTPSLGSIMDRLFNKDILSKATSAGVTGLQVGGVTAGAVGSLGLAKDLQSANRAEATKQVFQNIGTGVKNSELFSRMPEATQEIISRLTKDTPAENVFTPIDKWTTYWQEKGVDPGKVAEAIIGNRTQYDQATQTGEDLQIPTDKYATSIAPSEHNQFFADELKTSPDQMSAREAREYRSSLDAEDQKTQAEQTPNEISAGKVRADISDQLQKSGYDPSTAETYAKLYGAAFKSLGERTGEDPKALFDQYGLKVARPELGTLSTDDEQVLEQSGQPNASPFYSKLEKTIEQKMGNSATVEQVKGLTRDLKPEELQYSGLNDFLQGKEKVSKQELLDHLKGNQLQIKEVTKGDEGSIVKALPSYEEHISRDMEKNPGLSREDAQRKAFDSALGRAGGASFPNDVDVQLRQEFRDATGDRVSRSSGTKFSKYTLPGGENYREMLFTLPGKGDAYKTPGQLAEEMFGKKFYDLNLEEMNQLSDRQNEATFNPDGTRKAFPGYHSSHFDEPNVLAHTRLDDRIDSDGKKVLFAEEIQSDWHQEGRKKGYKSEDTRPRDVVEKELNEYGKSLLDKYKAQAKKDINGKIGLSEIAPFVTEAEQAHHAKLVREFNENAGQGTVPDAPFKKTWHEFVLKRLIREAAEKGYDKLAWTTGEQQAERYDLSKQVNRVVAIKEGDTFKLMAHDDRGSHEIASDVPKEKLESYIGKDLAAKIIADSEASKRKKNFHYSGVDLKVGGEGMKGFYDKILVDAANKLGKKFGAKVEDTNLSTDGGTDFEHLQVIPEDGEGFNVVQLPTDNSGEPEIVASFDTEKEAYDYINKKPGAGEDLKVHSLEITPALKAAALNEGFPLFQSGDEGARGQIRIGANRSMSIDLLKNADLSTFVHESGHFYLEVLGDLATKENSNPQLKADYDTILNWMGVKDRSEIGVDQHEQFARGFEAYLMEGKAPSSALRTAFARVRAWMVSIYRNLKNLNVNLNPEVRGVFDRLLASDDEISQTEKQQHMEPLFGADPKAYGMNEKEASKYVDALQEARAASEEALASKMMEEQKREQSKQWNAERERMREPIANEINQRPEYIAKSVLQKGELPNGEPLPEGVKPMKLSKAALLEMYDKNFLKRLPKPYLYSKEGGLHPDEVAPLFGFHSGDEMLTQILNAPDRETLINQKTDQAMEAKHGNLLTDGRLPEEAMKAVHTEKRAELLRSELQYLASEKLATLKGLVRKISRPIPTIEDVRAQADEVIAGKKVRDINSTLYEKAEAKSGKDAMDLLLKGDVEGAFEAKQRELQNHELYRSATNAEEAIEKTVDYLKRFDNKDVRAKVGKAGEEYLAQIDGLLNRFDLRTGTSLKEIDRRKTLLQWVQAQQKKGYDFDVPEKLLNEAYSQHYKDTSFEELSGLRDSVKSIEHLANLKFKLLANARFQDFQEAKTAILSSIGAHFDLTAEKIEPIAPGLKDRLLKTGEGIASIHARPEFIFRHLDGLKDIGEVWKNLFDPMNDAEAKENEMKRTSAEAIKEIMSAYTGKEQAMLGFNLYYIPEIKESLTKRNMLSVALNWGNLYNREALMRGKNWTDAQVQAILGRLDGRDWQAVQKLWNHIDTYWPQIEAMEKRLNGIAPEKVERAPFEAKASDGSAVPMEGGYYPILFDNSKSEKQHLLDAKSDVQDLMGGQYARAMTKRGHTQERNDTGGKPLSLELSGVEKHLGQVIHDLAYREAVIDVHKLLNDKDVRDGIQKAAGREMYRQLNPWLADIAGDRPRDPANLLERALGKARSGVTLVNLGFKFTSAIVHMANYSFAVKELGGGYALKGLQDTLMKPWNLKNQLDFAMSRSDLMKERLNLNERDIRDQMRTSNMTGGTGVSSVVEHYTKPIHDWAFMPMGTVDMGTTLPIWFGGYRKAMEGGIENVSEGDEANAVKYADGLVRRTKGSGSTKDLASIQRGSEAIKLLTMFYSPASVMFNQFLEANQSYRMEKNIPKLIGTMGMIWFLPAVIQGVIRGHTPNLQDSDLSDWAKWFAETEAFYPAESIILARDFATAIEGSIDRGHADFKGTPATEAGQSLVEGVNSLVKAAKDKELTRSDLKSGVTAFGYASGIPTRQAYMTLEYLYDWMNGEEEPSNPVEGVWRALVTGKKKEK